MHRLTRSEKMILAIIAAPGKYIAEEYDEELKYNIYGIKSGSYGSVPRNVFESLRNKGFIVLLNGNYFITGHGRDILNKYK